MAANVARRTTRRSAAADMNGKTVISDTKASPSGPSTSNKKKGSGKTSRMSEVKKQTGNVKPEDIAVSPTPASPSTKRKRSARNAGVKGEDDEKDAEDVQKDIKSVPVHGEKRKRTKVESDEDEYVDAPHNMGGSARTEDDEETEKEEEELPSAKRRSTKKPTAKQGKAQTSSQSAARTIKDQKDAERAVVQLATVKRKIAEENERREKATASGKKTKSDTYGLMEGETPFPRWKHPTAEECQEVHDILLKKHPDCHPQPQTIPPPSEFVAGCGEVRSILDALVRTRLSASTTGRNSNAAYQGMVKRYGLIKSGVGKGSCDYNAVRKAPVQDLFYAIKNGGLAVSKSADIKALLDIVYEDNQERRKQLLAAKGNSAKGPKGADIENEEQKAAEIKLAEDENLSLDHFYTLPTYDAIYKFMTFPGIGVKTAACVAMFCMQRPCFAVDTHVFRLSKWLGWVPPPEEKIKGEKNVDRDTTFSHLEVRMPDHLKYMLHQLFLKHGKTCQRCRGATGETSEGWEDGCVIDHLVERTGPRKGGGNSPVKAKKGGPKSKAGGRGSGGEEEDSYSES